MNLYGVSPIGEKMSVTLPKKPYKTELDIIETEVALKKVKDFFERALADALDLTRVSAPLFVENNSGLNDTLNGFERPVAFDIHAGANFEIIHSLAKWKRWKLRDYNFPVGQGLYTDMTAIRRDEDTDSIHSMYVDQWDWEKIIRKEDRNEKTLRDTVDAIFGCFKKTEDYITGEYPFLPKTLPEKITFISSQELEDMFPNMSAKEREHEICRRFGAVFISQIGGKLRSGAIHDGRAPDYDDWSLNGDILVYYDVLDIALELSSMGIRVDEKSMKAQLAERGCTERESLPFHSDLLAGKLPYTIGGGIGQSRMCMYFLKKAHIGEVQSSYWLPEDIETCQKNNIHLL